MEAELTGETADLLAKLSTASDAIQAAVDAIQDPSGQTDVAAVLEALRLSEAIATIDVDALADDLQGALNKGLGLLLGECELKKPRTGKLHPNRGVSKKLRTLIREQTSAKDRLTRLGDQRGGAQSRSEVEEAGSNSNDPEQNPPEQPPTPTSDTGCALGVDQPEGSEAPIPPVPSNQQGAARGRAAAQAVAGEPGDEVTTLKAQVKIRGECKNICKNRTNAFESAAPPGKTPATGAPPYLRQKRQAEGAARNQAPRDR
ncbi:hypothetical protein TSOC_013506 [Tetrabaena socialis]|uniref:Uncharacterized protein n=1 Tax=Tetrabaena socialis TaxID=47790 RepID=A0A2J7ZK71_9CHLO|nr:hypothetical protein TSOC_013506 [Tetrabaena socialis]|eukprot:PNH00664.1 hypothetical protein TSOC_013506 [Tetrabaena socialis]